MSFYLKNPEYVEALTFDEFVATGKVISSITKSELVNGMPWSFDFQGFHITHENDDCYRIGTFLTFKRGEMLILGPGKVRPVSMDTFTANYQPVKSQGAILNGTH